jgi:hypothetical protein
MPRPTACGVICRAPSISVSKILILSAGLILDWSAHRMATSTERPLTDLLPIDPGARLKEGQWGELYVTPFNLRGRFHENRASVATPWMLSTIPDLLKQYSFEIEPEETLKVNIFRKKSA